MAKLVLNDVASLQSESSALQTLAENNAAVENAVENTLSRDGSSPNQMEAPLDMNSNRLINLAAPQSGSDAARYSDIQNALSVTQLSIPAFVTGAILTNDGTSLSWSLPSAIAGLGDMKAANNLSELTSLSAARTNLGLGTAATVNVGSSGAAIGLLNGSLTWSGPNSWVGGCAFGGGVEFGGSGTYRMTSTGPVLADSIGYRIAPINTQNANYTMVMADAAATLLHTSATPHTWAIPPHASVAFPPGTPIVLVNEGSGAITISRGSGVVLRKAGSSTDADATLAANGMATLLKTADGVWRISGTGVS